MTYQSCLLNKWQIELKRHQEKYYDSVRPRRQRRASDGAVAASQGSAVPEHAVHEVVDRRPPRRGHSMEDLMADQLKKQFSTILEVDEIFLNNAASMTLDS